MITGKILRDAMISGTNNIANQRAHVDELNVFPVPDGDTGTNMSMTVGAAGRELAALGDDCSVEDAASVAALPCCVVHVETLVLSPACCSVDFPKHWLANLRHLLLTLFQLCKRVLKVPTRLL